MIIELGGGTNPYPRSDVVIDLHHPKRSLAQDATRTPWTSMASPGAIDSESADAVYSSHFMEHVHHGQPLINVMNEAWRVLRPGGSFTMILPLVGHTDQGGTGHMTQGWMPYADPTHVSFWWMPEALLYFCEGPFKPNANYGIHTWAPLGDYIDPDAATRYAAETYRTDDNKASFWSVRGGWEGVARLIKP